MYSRPWTVPDPSDVAAGTNPVSGWHPSGELRAGFEREIARGAGLDWVELHPQSSE
jgi:hypothetical protein